MEYRGELTRYRYISSGWPCEGWLVTLSAWEGERQLSLHELAKIGDDVVASAANWLAESYGDEEDPPEMLFAEEVWKSIEVDEEAASALLDALRESGWTVVRHDEKV